MTFTENEYYCSVDTHYHELKTDSERICDVALKHVIKFVTVMSTRFIDMLRTCTTF